MDNKQCATEKPIGQRRNQKRNKKIPWEKWKYKYYLPKFMGYKKFIVINIYPQEARKASKINNWIYHLKELDKGEQTNPKFSIRGKMTKLAEIKRLKINRKYRWNQEHLVWKDKQKLTSS